MIEIPELSPGRKALKTARWARIMTKWLITFSGGAKRKWRFVEFGGPTGSESRGIVDILAIRKDHGSEAAGFKRGDCFEIVFIQTKGGQAARPTDEDLRRLRRLARRITRRPSSWRSGEKVCTYSYFDCTGPTGALRPRKKSSEEERSPIG